MSQEQSNDSSVDINKTINEHLYLTVVDGKVVKPENFSLPINIKFPADGIYILGLFIQRLA